MLSCGVLEHVTDPAASLGELHRVLYHGQLEQDTIYTPDSARRLVAGHGFRVLDTRLANMLPLSIDHPVVARLRPLIWAVNVAL